MVGPWLPHTASASVWPICSISEPTRSRASFTASMRDSEASPSLSAPGPGRSAWCGVLHHQPQALEAHQIAVRLGRAHAGRGGQVAQHQRPADWRQHLQQRKTHLDRLDACTFFVHVH
jgi:hypothetical protein